MSGSMMRVTSELQKDIKLLKEVKAAKGKLGTHSDLIHDLVKTELRKTRAYTEDGYLAEGAVVLGPVFKPVVIKSIGNDKVVFSDDTYVINGGTACYNLKLLSENVEEFEEGLYDV